MFAVIETAEFLAWYKAVWSDQERDEFISWIADNADSGEVIPGSGGIRKVRYSRRGMGKQGGARVIYYVRNRREKSYCFWFMPKPNLTIFARSF